jgi:apolipoprotein N-acyltransferase
MNQIVSPVVVPLSRIWQGLYLIISFLIVAFGQPAWSVSLSALAALGGYAIFWRAMWARPTFKQRFWLATIWFTAVQLVQLSWFISHPYGYIWAVYLFFAIAIGFQFGAVSLLVFPERILHLSQIIVIAAAWTLMEWVRLFFLSGFTFDPAGLALSAHLYSLQTASLWGIYGMTFYVMLTNLLLSKAWLLHHDRTATPKWHPFAIFCWVCVAAFPYLFGAIHFSVREKMMAEHSETVDVLLVQTGFPIEELLSLDRNSSVKYVMDEWRQILHLLGKYKGKHIDFIAMPEAVVPYGTYYAMYPYSEVRKSFYDILGADTISHLPGLEEHLAMHARTEKGNNVLVNNAYWAQAIANLFRTPVIVGFDDHEQTTDHQNHSYNAAMTFLPGVTAPQRYEKRVLLPLGEYLPFSFLQSLATKYGVGGSFTCGTEPKIIKGVKIPITPSICYEETFGHLMRENRLIGGEMLVNITSDVWYPNSMLPKQHFDLARLRTVENGMPLVRACSTGITCAIDSLGRVVGIIGEDDKNAEWLSEAMLLKVPTYNYTTLYTHTGDDLVIGICWLIIIIAFGRWNYLRNKEQE